MIDYKGKLGLLVAIPVLGSLIAAFDLAGLAGEIAGLLELTVTFVPPSVAGVAQVLAAVTAALQAGFTPPSIDFKATLLAKLGLLKAKYDLVLNLQTLLTGGSVRVYEYSGRADAFGAELTTVLAGADVDGGIQPAQQTFAVLLVAEAGSASATALKTLRGEV